MDFSQWLVLTHEDVPEEVAYLAASIIVEDRQAFEARYTSLPLSQSALHYPMRPEAMGGLVPIPLHPGAERYYREHGYL